MFSDVVSWSRLLDHKTHERVRGFRPPWFQRSPDALSRLSSSFKLQRNVRMEGRMNITVISEHQRLRSLKTPKKHYFLFATEKRIFVKSDFWLTFYLFICIWLRQRFIFTGLFCFLEYFSYGLWSYLVFVYCCVWTHSITYCNNKLLLGHSHGLLNALTLLTFPAALVYFVWKQEYHDHPQHDHGGQ